MAKEPTKKEMQERIEEISLAYSRKVDELSSAKREMEKLKDVFNISQSDLNNSRSRTKELSISMNSIATIINGEAKDESKVEVLKDVIKFIPGHCDMGDPFQYSGTTASY